MAVYPAGRLLNVQDAYDALEDYGKTFGRVPLLLLLHAAVPQSFRADMLNLVKLNFLAHEAGTDLTVDADVLFSPLVDSTAAGYYRLDPEVRRHCLALLDAAYRYEPERRTVEVARFVLVYADAVERRAGLAVDPLLAEFLAIQRWVAFAFIDPAKAAEEFAWVLENSAAEPQAGVRARLGTMTAALSIPLEGHEQLLAYARGLEAITRGDEDFAEGLFTDLGQEEIRVGGVVLNPGRRVLERRRPASAEVVHEGPPMPRLRPKVCVSYSIANGKEAQHIAETLQEEGFNVFLDGERTNLGSTFEQKLLERIRVSDFLVIVISQNLLRGDPAFFSSLEEQAVRTEMHLRRPESGYLIAVLLDETRMAQLPEFMRDVQAVPAPDGRLPDGFATSLWVKYIASQSARGTVFPRATPPTLLPEYAQRAIEKFLRSTRSTVLLIEGGGDSAIEQVPELLTFGPEGLDLLLAVVNLSDYAAGRTPADVAHTIAAQTGVDGSQMPTPLAEQTDARHIRQLADWLRFVLRDRETVVVLKGFENAALPWQVLDMIRQLIVDAVDRTRPLRFVLLNFTERLPASVGLSAKRIALGPVTREDVLAYLRTAFQQRGQQVPLPVLEAATDEVLRSVREKGRNRTYELSRALERAVRLLFEET
jgi:hypothetical protein